MAALNVMIKRFLKRGHLTLLRKRPMSSATVVKVIVGSLRRDLPLRCRLVAFSSIHRRICRVRALKRQTFAISKHIRILKQTPAQSLRALFTDDECVISFPYAWDIGKKQEVKCRTLGKCCQTSVLVDINSTVRWHARITPCTIVNSHRKDHYSELHLTIASHAVSPF
ncbi:hypothetical protein XH94_35705 [Bradyrhizobium zhanjiangense]|uniref:Uncharacterized protein n=1 Tax=Bradyrhizobium zhanjiangense TaxID=1325107 RepID=A0A4Q0S0C1_9BRAD|nr:hypothetical protein XH94_35705 [Bradyrhizobium zhanjiangense]